MRQQEIEVILMRHLAAYLSVPILIVDPQGDLLFFNESAEPILGQRFDETGVIRRGEWSDTFKPLAADGTPIPREEMPLFIATEQRRAAHGRSWIRGLDGVTREIEGIAFPLCGLRDRCVGAVGIFWEISRS